MLAKGGIGGRADFHPIVTSSVSNVAKRIQSPRSALYLIFQLITKAQKRWRRLNAPELVAKVICGIKYENGQEVKTTTGKKRRKVSA